MRQINIKNPFAKHKKPTTTPVEEPPMAQNSKLSGLSSLLLTLLVLLLAPAIAILLTAFVVQSYQVDGQSMETTLQNHDRLIVDKVPRTWARVTGKAYIPNRGDIIIFNQISLPGYVGEKQLIKRVIGVPGDRVVINNGTVKIYNSAHPRGFNPDTSGGYYLANPITVGQIDITLKQGQVFVCGDNRSNSEDSRYFGPISAQQIVGKLSIRILPFNKVEHF